MESKFFVFGASGHGKVVVDVIQSMGLTVKCIIDDNPNALIWQNIPIHCTNDIQIEDDWHIILGVGNNKTRKKIFSSHSFKYFKAIHKQATIANSATVGEGSVVMAQVVINAGAKIGNHCIINTSSVIEHDCEIADFAHISPKAALAGNVTVGEGTHVGIGAVVIQGIKIGKWATVGAGTVVIHDVPDYAVVVGNPCRIIKYNTP